MMWWAMSRNTANEIATRAQAAWSGDSIFLWIAVAIAVAVLAFFIWDYWRDWQRRREIGRRFEAPRANTPPAPSQPAPHPQNQIVRRRLERKLVLKVPESAPAPHAEVSE
jgi:hypothetical protein